MSVNSLWFASLRVCGGSGAGRNRKETCILRFSQLYYLSHLRKISISSLCNISPTYLKLLAQNQGHIHTLYIQREQDVMWSQRIFLFTFISLNSVKNILLETYELPSYIISFLLKDLTANSIPFWSRLS